MSDFEINNETLGQSAEKVICDLFDLNTSEFHDRSHIFYEKKLFPLITQAVKELPQIMKHSGLEKGIRGKSSKSPIDFYLDHGQTLSVKTNKSSNFKVCPSEVGQSSWTTLEKYFSLIMKENKILNLNKSNFKIIVFNSIDKIIPIYIEHLFYCDYLLWIFYKSNSFHYKIFRKKMLLGFNWELKNFTFSQDIQSWNESCSVRYNNISFGEFQLHNNRKPEKKFRFNLNNLSKILNL